MIKLNIDVPLKGKRNYIRGADLYTVIVNSHRILFPGIQLKGIQIKFQKFASQQCELYISESETDKCNPKSFSTIFFREANYVRKGWLVEINDQPLSRIEYDESIIGNKTKVIENSAIVNGLEFYLPIDILVGATKKMHEKLFGTKEGKWMLVALNLNRILDISDSNYYKIQLKSNLGTFTESVLLKNEDPIGTFNFACIANIN